MKFNFFCLLCQEVTFVENFIHLPIFFLRYWSWNLLKNFDIFWMGWSLRQYPPWGIVLNSTYSIRFRLANIKICILHKISKLLVYNMSGNQNELFLKIDGLAHGLINNHTILHYFFSKFSMFRVWRGDFRGFSKIC